MKKLFFCAAALLAAISFSACSDDDETNLTATPDTIAGTWQIVHEEGWEIYDGEKDTWSENYPDEEGWYWAYTFDKSGSYVETVYENNEVSYTENGTYSISDNTLTLKAYGESSTREITKLTESKLVWHYSYFDEYDEVSGELTETYIRIE